MTVTDGSALRRELRSLLDAAECARPPALRRSLREDFLYASDLPLCAAPEACGVFLRKSGEAGWEAVRDGDWICLRPRALRLSGTWWDSLPPGGEAACLRILAERHPDLFASPVRAVRLLKAREEGDKALEAVCRELHREAARLLRENRTRELRSRRPAGNPVKE